MVYRLYLYIELDLFFLRTFGTIFRTALVTTFHAGGIKGTADDVVTNTGKIFYPATTYQHNAVFLKVVTFTGYVGIHFLAIAQTNTGNFAKCRVRFLGRGSVNTCANTTTLGA
jgi:hypothetical protein